MGHIHVPGSHHRLGLRQLQQVSPERVLPGHPVVEALQPVLGIGRVDRHEIKIFEFRRNHPALVVVLVDAQPVGHRNRLFFAKYGRSGVSFFLGVVPVLMVPRQVQFYLSFLQFCLLQAKYIGVCCFEKVQKSFFHRGAQSVYIP